MPAFKLRITGRVQGVFFRSSTKKKAEGLNVAGWVRNVEDGSVEVFAEGAEVDLQELIKWCRKGPEGARVENVEIEDAVTEGCQAFQIQ